MIAKTAVHFHRRRGPHHYSLEKVFAEVRRHLPDGMRAVAVECPRESRGFINRVINMMWAARNQGTINHITGDIHYLAITLKKRRTILTIHDCACLINSRGLKRWLLWLFWYRIPLSRSGLVTAVSEFTKAELLRYLKRRPQRISVIHDPYGQEFRPSPKAFNAGRPVILQVGTGWNKNLERVARALAGISCRLVIVGPLSRRQRAILEDNWIEYDNFVGISEAELVSLYRQCDIVVFASLYEGFGLPIVEAQAVGRPVVTSDRCSMPEVAGGAACLVDPECVSSIREGILRLIHGEDYRESLIRAGFENVKRFAPEHIAAQYADLYRSLAS